MKHKNAHINFPLYFFGFKTKCSGEMAPEVCWWLIWIKNFEIIVTCVFFFLYHFFKTVEPFFSPTPPWHPFPTILISYLCSFKITSSVSRTFHFPDSNDFSNLQENQNIIFALETKQYFMHAVLHCTGKHPFEQLPKWTCRNNHGNR